LAAAYLRWDEESVRTILTIHNIAYQGVFEKERLHRLVKLLVPATLRFGGYRRL